MMLTEEVARAEVVINVRYEAEVFVGVAVGITVEMVVWSWQFGKDRREEEERGGITVLKCYNGTFLFFFCMLPFRFFYFTLGKKRKE